MLLDRSIDEQRAAVALARALRVPDAAPSATLTHGAEPEFTYGWRAAVADHAAAVHPPRRGRACRGRDPGAATAQRHAALLRIEAEVSAAAAVAEAQRLAYVRYRDTILPQSQQVATMAEGSYRAGQTSLGALLQVLQASRELRLRSLDTIAEFQNAIDRSRAAPPGWRCRERRGVPLSPRGADRWPVRLRPPRAEAGRRRKIESAAVVAVKTAPAAVRDIVGVVHATGVVAPAPGAELVVVAPEVARIVEMPRAAGDAVRRGDVLVRFEMPAQRRPTSRSSGPRRRGPARAVNQARAAQRAPAICSSAASPRAARSRRADRAAADAEAARRRRPKPPSPRRGRWLAARSVRATFAGIVAARRTTPATSSSRGHRPGAARHRSAAARSRGVRCRSADAAARRRRRRGAARATGRQARRIARR